MSTPGAINSKEASMARFKLLAPHELDIMNSFYEQKLVNNWGKNVTEKWDCHRMLNPDDPNDCNYNAKGLPQDETLGEDPCVVINTKPHRKDYVIRNPEAFRPSTEMEPLDEEAQALMEKWKPRSVMQAMDALPMTMGEVPQYEHRAGTPEFAAAVAVAVANALKGDPFFAQHSGSVYKGHQLDTRP
jgi:hypothetical protein